MIENNHLGSTQSDVKPNDSYVFSAFDENPPS